MQVATSGLDASTPLGFGEASSQNSIQLLTTDIWNHPIYEALEVPVTQ